MVSSLLHIHVCSVKFLPKSNALLSVVRPNRVSRTSITFWYSPSPLLPGRMPHASIASSLTKNGCTEGLSQQQMATSKGDLNNTSAMRATEPPQRDPSFAYRSLAIDPHEDDSVIRKIYRPFLLSEEIQSTDWISRLELATATKMANSDLQETGSRLKVLVLYGSLRKRLE